jgi:predicted lipoprotein with Yx(FWY)xxD motif
MQAKRLAAASALMMALIVAGCGSSSQSPTTPAAASSSSSSVNPYGHSAPSGGSSASSVALITTKQDKKLGTILAYGPKKLTVYLFEADKGSSPSCTGACAKVWPPVTGKPKTSGSASSSDLGTVKTPGGQTQVTYKGHPLYLYVKDGDAGDAYGEGINSFGAGWYVLKPSGEKVDLS